MTISIREWKLSDAGALAAAINNKNVQDNLRDGIPFPYTAADAEEFINATLGAPAGSQYAFAICADGAAVGSIGVFRGQNVHRLTAEMGYFIGQPHWGKGIVTKAIGDVCRYIFENTDIVRIYAEPYAHNAASCRALEKAGFTLEGVLRKNAVKNGRIVDMKMYSLIK